jgi:OOP family OmpA-OmpF porin
MDKPGDADMDGVPDNIDVCPKTAPGTKVDERGCMIMEKDSDGDGVLDSADQCPNTPAGALIDMNGCQKELEKEVSVELKINFANDSDVITAQYNAELQRVADFMRQYAGTQVQIEGHTDSVGRAAYNQALSERRAQSVAKALTERFGIDASRISSVGYGETRPVADNDTADGRLANRRVVAVINERVKEKQWQ